MNDKSNLLEQLFRAAVAAADPKHCVAPYLPARPDGRTIVIGAGKASAAMARAVEDHWEGDLEGLVVTRYGHGVPCERIEIVEAAHPVPDEAGLAAAARMVELVSDLSPDDLVLCLISGGGSALLTAPAAGISLDDKQDLNRQLLASGAVITEMNCVRKHLSAIKGGRLAAAAAPARVVSLLISDIPGDDPAAVASGPTVADPTTVGEARAIIEKYKLRLTPSMEAFLSSDAAETPKPGDPSLARAETHMIATPGMAIAAAAALAREHGYNVHVLGDAVEGESRDVGKAHAEIALAVAEGRGPVSAPAAILSGGETTVTLRGRGRGGPNAEYALGLAIALDGRAGINAMAGDTDGIDGSEDNAGAMVTPDILARGAAAGVDAAERLADNDAYGFFEAVDGLLMTGPTLTNVNDFRVILVED